MTKTSLTKNLTLPCFGSLLFLLVHYHVNAETITIMGEYHPPLNSKPKEEKPGFMIEIAQAILAKHGHSIDYILGPRTRAVRLAQDGSIDCVVNAKIKDHHFLAFPEEPWGYHAATLFSLPNSTFKYSNINQLESIRLGAIANMRYDNGAMDDYLEKKTTNTLFSYGKDAMNNQVRRLLNGQSEAVVSCPLLMRGQLKSMGISPTKIKIVGEVKPYVGMYFACGKGNRKTKEVIHLINRTLPLLRESGELQAILARYGQIDWLDIYQSLLTPH